MLWPENVDRVRMRTNTTYISQLALDYNMWQISLKFEFHTKYIGFSFHVSCRPLLVSDNCSFSLLFVGGFWWKKQSLLGPCSYHCIKRRASKWAQGLKFPTLLSHDTHHSLSPSVSQSKPQSSYKANWTR